MNQKLTVGLAAGTGPDIIDADASYYVAYYAKGVWSRSTWTFSASRATKNSRPATCPGARIRHL